ncbi:hypothetical protein D3C81_1205480 [compost metagenome]
MSTRKPIKPYPISEAQLLELKNELYSARRIIIDLIPDETLRSILMSYQECKVTDNARVWVQSISDRIANLAKVRPAAEMGDFPSNSPRACCPLCGGESEAVAKGISGFAVPDGLKRHLLGSHLTSQCKVLAAAMQLCREHLDELDAPR